MSILTDKLHYIYIYTHTHTFINCIFDLWGFPGGSDGEESACNEGSLGSIPGLGTPPGGGNGNPLQFLTWRIPMHRGAWWATVLGITKSQT